MRGRLGVMGEFVRVHNYGGPFSDGAFCGNSENVVSNCGWIRIKLLAALNLDMSPSIPLSCRNRFGSRRQHLPRTDINEHGMSRTGTIIRPGLRDTFGSIQYQTSCHSA